jgi:hypothetical protein
LVAGKAEEWDKVPVKVLVAAVAEVETAEEDIASVVIVYVPSAVRK